LITRVAELFKGDIVALENSPKWIKVKEPSEKILTAIPVRKVNKSDFKQAPRVLVLSNKVFLFFFFFVFFFFPMFSHPIASN